MVSTAPDSVVYAQICEEMVIKNESRIVWPMHAWPFA